MGKTKQSKEKKFDRNVEISAPILDPEIIKAIHTPPKGQRLDIRHGGFKALLSDLNSQDSVDELMPITENHVPSYIGISCAVSGYSNYSSYVKKQTENAPEITTKTTTKTTNRSQTSSPIASKEHLIKHITLDKNAFNSPDEERKKLTEELTASATERRLSPSPLPPIEDDRHHGAYVGARYFPMPPPSKVVNKHIPLLGIDDDQDPDEHVSDEGHKVEQKIASLYGDNFVEDWRESMSHKSKKEHIDEAQSDEQQKAAIKSPKDLVSLKPTPKSPEPIPEPIADVPTPNIKVLASVEKEFLNKLLTDENPPMPKSPPPLPTSQTSKSNAESPTARPAANKDVDLDQLLSSPEPPVSIDSTKAPRSPSSPVASLEHQSSPPRELEENTQEEQLISLGDANEPVPDSHNSPIKLAPEFKLQNNNGQNQASISCHDGTIIIKDDIHNDNIVSEQQPHEEAVAHDDIINFADSPVENEDISEQEPPSQPMSPDSGKNQSIHEEFGVIESQLVEGHVEEHIEYEIRAKSPVDNQSSPIRLAPTDNVESNSEPVSLEKVDTNGLEQSLSADNANLEQLINVNETSNSNDSSYGDEVSPVRQASNLEQILEETEVVEDMADKFVESIIERGSGMDEPDSGLAQKIEEAIVSDNNNNGLYYLNLLEQEKSFIRDHIERTQCILDEHEAELDEDRLGRLRSAIGKANLLINKKCNQFKELCERSINKRENEQYAVLNDDLAGFWDMLSIQFTDVRKSFENL